MISPICSWAFHVHCVVCITLCKAEWKIYIKCAKIQKLFTYTLEHNILVDYVS